MYGVATEDGASSSRLPSRISSINWNFNEDELDGITGDEGVVQTVAASQLFHLKLLLVLFLIIYWHVGLKDNYNN